MVKNFVYLIGNAAAPPPVVDYYVSSAGAGAGNGSSDANPASLATFVANLASMAAGTNILFKRGETFLINNLAIPENYITVGAWGVGADPIILGSEDLSGAVWTSEAGGYYSTPLASEPKWIFLNGEAARQGESPWIPITATPSSKSRTALAATLNAYNSVESLVGAKLRVKEYVYRLSFEHNITAYNTGTGVLGTTETFVGADIGMPFKLYGQKQFATQENDWWWDSANSKLWIKKSTSPSGTDIRVTYSDRAFSVTSKSGVQFIGLEFKHYYKEAIYSSSANVLTIDGCYIHDIRTNAIFGIGASDGVTIQNSTITRCGLNGISFGKWVNYVIQNNTISYIGDQDNLGWPIDSGWLKTGGVSINAMWEGGVAPGSGYVYRNTISHVGYNGYTCIGDGNIAEENVIEFYLEKFTDGGGIYTFHRSDLGASTNNNLFRRNIILNAVGSTDGVVNPSGNQIAGIYIDNGTRETTIDKNTIIGATSGTSTCKNGIFCNGGSTNTIITDNVFYNHSRACVCFYQMNGWSDPDHSNTNINNVMTGNTLIASRTDNYCFAYGDDTGLGTSYNPFGGTGSSNNNSYIAPYNISSHVVGYTFPATDSPFSNQLTLASYQSLFGDDAASNAIANTLIGSNALIRDAGELVVNYNPTTVVESISIGANYVDRFNDPIISADIAAFESVTYFSTVNLAILLDGFIGSNGTNIAGRSPQIGNIPFVLSGTHTINGNKLVSSVDGLISWNLGSGQDDYVLEVLTELTNIASIMRMDARLQDDAGSANNRIVLDFTGGNIRLREFYDSATATQTLTAAFSLATGINYTVRLYCSGATIKAYVNNVLYLTMTTSLTTGTRVGVFGQTTRRVDTLVVFPDELLIP